MASMENRLLQYGAKEYFFKAVICQFCLDADKARVSMASTPPIRSSLHTNLLQAAMEKYIEMFPAFEGTREQRLLVVIQVIVCPVIYHTHSFKFPWSEIFVIHAILP